MSLHETFVATSETETETLINSVSSLSQDRDTLDHPWVEVYLLALFMVIKNTHMENKQQIIS